MAENYSYDYEWDKEYCYPNSYVLKNELNILDSLKLSVAEREITSLKIAVAKANVIKGKLDFSHLKAMHKFIFEDIYVWAGEPRHVNISKGSQFCLANYIVQCSNQIFKELKSENYLIGFKSNIANKLAYYMSELNAVHPFREGNGRTQRLFIEYVAGVAGYGVDFSTVSSKEMIEASAESFIGRYEKINTLFNNIVYVISLEEQEDYITNFFGNNSNEMKLFIENQNQGFDFTL